LIADPTGYIFTWLVGYSSLLGPVGGIMIADYYFVKKKQLNVNELFNPQGIYSYNNGFNKTAVIALLAGILPNVPGFLLTINAVSSSAFPVWISDLYHYAWFVGFGVSAVVYLLIHPKMKTQNETIVHSEQIVSA
jgi:NCS1 family nucleobase:cation symporter-1